MRRLVVDGDERLFATVGNARQNQICAVARKAPIMNLGLRVITIKLDCRGYTDQQRKSAKSSGNLDEASYSVCMAFPLVWRDNSNELNKTIQETLTIVGMNSRLH